MKMFLRILAFLLSLYGATNPLTALISSILQETPITESAKLPTAIGKKSLGEQETILFAKMMGIESCAPEDAQKALSLLENYYNGTWNPFEHNAHCLDSEIPHALATVMMAYIEMGYPITTYRECYNCWTTYAKFILDKDIDFSEPLLKENHIETKEAFVKARLTWPQVTPLLQITLRQAVRMSFSYYVYVVMPKLCPGCNPIEHYLKYYNALVKFARPKELDAAYYSLVVDVFFFLEAWQMFS